MVQHDKHADKHADSNTLLMAITEGAVYLLVMIGHRCIGFLGEFWTAGFAKDNWHGLHGILAFHKLHFDCYVTGRTLSVSEVQ